MFHGQDEDRDGDQKWDYYSDDDDALVLYNHPTQGEAYAMGNIEEIIVCSQKPPEADLTSGDAIRSGTPRSRIGVNYPEPDKVVMLIRIYQEADADGHVLDGFDHKDRKYYHLPLQCEMPMDYFLSRSLLGHVRLKPQARIKRKAVTRMYYETHPSDRQDLIGSHTGM